MTLCPLKNKKVYIYSIQPEMILLIILTIDCIYNERDNHLKTEMEVASCNEIGITGDILHRTLRSTAAPRFMSNKFTIYYNFQHCAFPFLARNPTAELPYSPDFSTNGSAALPWD